MWPVLAAGGCAALVGVFVWLASRPSPPPPPSSSPPPSFSLSPTVAPRFPAIVLTPAATGVLGSAGELALRGGLAAYRKRYGCSTHERLVVDAVGIGRRVRLGGDGATETTVAISTPGRIDLVPEEVAGSSVERLRYIALHEATHACPPSEPRRLERPVPLLDGALATGIHGFVVLVRLPDGSGTRFTMIEEGAAEALAHLADARYVTESIQYAHIGSLTLRLLHARGLRGEEIQDLIEANDLPGFATRILGREPGPMRPADLVATMDAYQKAWEGASIDALLDALLEERAP